MTIQTAIQLPEETFERLKAAAEGMGQTTTAFIQNAILERLEDIEDANRAEEILSKVRTREMKTYTLEEVSRDLGLDD